MLEAACNGLRCRQNFVSSDTALASLVPVSFDFNFDIEDMNKDCDIWQHARVTKSDDKETVCIVSSGEGHLTVIVYGHAPEGQE
jgi:hypothetical protein